MFVFSVFLYIVVGAIAGLLGALLGIGGGSITVPALLLIFSYLGFPHNYVMHIAIGTSLSAMVINSLAATYFHHKKHGVVWKAVERILLGILLGSFVGTVIAKELSSNFLQILFGILACLMGLILIKSDTNSSEHHKMPNFFIFNIFGFGIATIANLLGVGGGFFMNPLLLYFRFKAKLAIGTSSATSCLISIGGALGYVFSTKKGINFPNCFGYIYIPAFLAIGLSSLIASFYGVKLVQSLSSNALRKIFALSMVVIGLSMIIV